MALLPTSEQLHATPVAGNLPISLLCPCPAHTPALQRSTDPPQTHCSGPQPAPQPPPLHPPETPPPTFWELAARLSLAKSELGSTVPRKMGLNWFMPALLQGKMSRQERGESQ